MNDCPFREAALAFADAVDDLISTWEAGDIHAALKAVHESLESFDQMRTSPCAPERDPLSVRHTDRFRLALDIVDPGACNPSGIALALIDACRLAREDGEAATRDPAVRLIVTQLAWVCSADSDIPDYAELLTNCRSHVRAPTVAQQPTQSEPPPNGGNGE